MQPEHVRVVALDGRFVPLADAPDEDVERAISSCTILWLPSIPYCEERVRTETMRAILEQEMARRRNQARAA